MCTHHHVHVLVCSIYSTAMGICTKAYVQAVSSLPRPNPGPQSTRWRWRALGNGGCNSTIALVVAVRRPMLKREVDLQPCLPCRPCLKPCRRGRLRPPGRGTDATPLPPPPPQALSPWPSPSSGQGADAAPLPPAPTPNPAGCSCSRRLSHLMFLLRLEPCCPPPPRLPRHDSFLRPRCHLQL